MKSMICVLTYRRVGALQETLRGLSQHCAHYPIAVFEDCGQRDGTSRFLSGQRKAVERRDLLATEMVLHGAEDTHSPRVFLGSRNLGVAGNSNRAIRHFMESDCDHLCLLNDDLHILGDFVNFYAQGHSDLGVGMFCFCPSGGVYSHDSYRWVTVRSRGYTVRLMPRLTGIMISFTRKLLERVGYFDTRFPKFGQEHCDMTYRCRFAGGIKLGGQDQNCLDIEPSTPLLVHQDVETSVVGADRKKANADADVAMHEASKRYAHEHYYRPFRLQTPKWVGSFGGRQGIPFSEAPGYELVTDLV